MQPITCAKLVNISNFCDIINHIKRQKGVILIKHHFP